MRLITHYNVDLDAAASVWAARRFIPNGFMADLVFKPANWDGKDATEDDIIVDISAGGKGIKGDIDTVGQVSSAFRLIVDTYATADDKRALSGLVDYVNTQDSTGSALRVYVPGNKESQRVLGATGLNAVLHGFKATLKDDTAVIEKMGEIFDGLREVALQRWQAEAEAGKAQLFHGGKIALVVQENGSNNGINGVLFGMGVLVVIYQSGYNLGIVTSRDCLNRADHDMFRQVVHDAGEADEWFSHPAGFLYCRGSNKALAVSPSKVKPQDLIAAVAKLGSDWPEREDSQYS